jgi:proton-dependent oligopeptide transporter, POT family
MSDSAQTITKTNFQASYYLILFNGISSISFGILASIISVYAKSKLGLSSMGAISLNSAFLGILFTMPILFGYLANQLGYVRSMVFGSIIGAIAFIFMLFPGAQYFYLGVAAFSIATSQYYTAMLVILGKLYEKNDPRRHAVYTLSYVAMNIGICIGGFVGGSIAQYYSYHMTFIISAILSIVSLGFALISLPYIKNTHYREFSLKSNKASWFFIIAITCVSIPISAWLLNHAVINNALLIIVVSLVTLALVIYAIKQKDKQTKLNILLFLILSGLSVGFWVLYSLEPSYLTLFIKSNVQRHIFNTLIPASDFYGLESFFVILLGIPLTYLWLKLAKKNLEPSIGAKFALSLFIMGAGFVLLMLASRAHPSQLLNPVWIIVSYVLLSTAELLISPVGNAMVGQLVPPKMEGTIMGFWQGIIGVAAAIAAFAIGFVHLPTAKETLSVSNHAYESGFGILGFSTIGLGVVALLILPWANKVLKKQDP